jgi:hypothetical protein
MFIRDQIHCFLNDAFLSAAFDDWSEVDYDYRFCNVYEVQSDHIGMWIGH